MRRHQRRVVIGRFRVDVVAARRLDQHRDIADAEAGDREAAAIEPARPEERIALGRAPARRDLPAARAAAGWRKTPNIRRRTAFPRPARSGRALVGPASSRCISAAPSSGSIADPVAGLAQRVAGSRSPMPACRARRRCRCGRRGSGSWRGRARSRRSAGGLRAQPRPVARQIGDEGDAVGDRPIADEIGLGLGIAAERRLERDGARQDAAVDLGQRHVHREIARAEAARAAAPRSPRRRRRRRPAGPGNRRCQRIVAPPGADSENPVALRITAGGCAAKTSAEQRGGFGILEAVHEDRQRPQPRAPPAPATSASTGAVLPDCTSAR